MKRSRHFCFERLESRSLLSVNGDFNGDGFDDLAIGYREEDVGGIVNAGAVSVIYGSRRGLAASGNQFWHQNVPGINGAAGTSDQFGWSLAVGDFNDDGYSDLAIGVFGETVNGRVGAGAVNVIYGSKTGLRATNDQLWTQDSAGINDAAEAGDNFGYALAVGDFNDDGRDDLAIGVPKEDVGAIVDAGMVNVLYGSGSGLTSANDQHWHQNSSGINDAAESGDQFGLVLAAGDFNRDGRDDLAVGVQLEDIGTTNSAGAVNVIYGSSSRLTGVGDQFWNQDTAGIDDAPETVDFFGGGLAVGDFNGDRYDDLAIAAYNEALGGISNAGLIHLLNGSSNKLISSGSITASSLGFSNSSSTFGASLAAGDFDDDGNDDLAIGAASETVLGQASAGAVYAAYGSKGVGLTAANAQRWHQDSTPNMPDVPQVEDYFGNSLTTGDYNGDGYVDLAIAIPRENLGGLTDVGAVQILYGFFIGLVDSGNQFWRQNLLNATDGEENFDGGINTALS